MRNLRSAVAAWACMGWLFGSDHAATAAEVEPDIQRRLQQLQEQNESLQRQISKQAELIENLSRKVSSLENPTPAPAAALPTVERSPTQAEPAGGFQLGKVNLSGEGGLAFFHSGKNGQFPNSEFRVDEAKLFVEAPVFKDTYFFSEINLFTRESDSADLNLGELYLDFENLSRFWNRERMLSLRIGRMDIPFGEEYLVRDAIDNPLISHSLSDLWGVDEGVELYGTLGKFQYVLAVQNGGHPPGRDYNSDKAVVGRVSYDPVNWLHLSVSGMRTGDLDAQNDGVSEIWFGNGFIWPVDTTGQATLFHGELVEGDVQVRLPDGHLKAAGGYLHFNDNAPGVDDERDIYYYYGEALYRFIKTFYGAARFSQILAADGYRLIGNGQYNNVLTTDLWRLSLGLGYQPGANLLFKGEYSFNGGRTITGESRIHENLFALEAAFKF